MIRTDYDKYRVLLEINNAIMHERTREGLFRETTNVLNKYFFFDHIDILLKQQDEHENWFFFSKAIGVQIPGFPEEKFPVSRGSIPREAMKRKKTVVADVASDTQRPESAYLRRAGLNWVISCPLIIWDTVIGSVQLCYKQKPLLSGDRLDLLENVVQQLTLAVENMLAYEKVNSLKDKLIEEKIYLQQEIETLEPSNRMVYASSIMYGLMEDIRNIATTDSTVLITGETGTGKDLVARTIHELSARKNNTFIKLNCAALVPTLIESELFGHERGSFTGASSRKIGRFELAHNSTLFLDEITELPLNTQAKLLQVLQEGTFERVGGTETLQTDVRILAASNLSITRLIERGRFRRDLYYRLNIVPVHVPPLRERREDIPALGRFFGEAYCEKLHRKRPVFTQDAIDALLQYRWPGNVRELQNFVERVIILKSGKHVSAEDISGILIGPQDTADETTLQLEHIEKRHIEKVLKKTGGVVAGPRGAAALLGMKRGTLQYRLRKFGIDPGSFKQA